MVRVRVKNLLRVPPNTPLGLNESQASKRFMKSEGRNGVYTSDRQLEFKVGEELELDSLFKGSGMFVDQIGGVPEMDPPPVKVSRRRKV